MTIQFRSRIRSTFDYGAELKQSGKCCFSDGTSENITFFECFSRSGTFLTDVDAPCPTGAEKGYCCACSYLSAAQKETVIDNIPYTVNNLFFQDSSFGIESNVTKCECDRIGGNWNKTDSNFNICKKQVIVNGNPYTIDSRIPNACCSFIIQEGSPIGVTCQNVCNARDCANLAIVDSGPDDPFKDTTFTINKTCKKQIVAGIDPVNCQTSGITSRLISNSAVYSNEPMGPCYVLNEESLDYSCTIQPEFQCSGYWINPDSIDAEVAYCDHVYSPKNFSKTQNFLNPISYTQSEFNSLGLQVGDEFQGGIYIGTFIPKKPTNGVVSQVYGALNFSSPSVTSYSVSEESSYKKWAIIVNKTFLSTILLYPSDPIFDPRTSYYDGYLNCYGDLTRNASIQGRTINTIKEQLRNGFIDYYIPSIIEMMFLAQQYRTNSSLSDVLDLNETFCSTTFVTDKYLRAVPTGVNTFGDSNLLYGQSFISGTNYGRNVTLAINRNVNFLLFRRVVIT